MILLVVVHHSAQPYGPADWWYVRGGHRIAALGSFSAVGGAFRMALLFFIAGYFVPRSWDRKGGAAFLRGRFKRLGLPFLVGSATIIPGLMYAYHVHYRGYPPISFGRYYLDFFLGFGGRPPDWAGPSWPDLQFGHLWFIQNLLAYCLLYAACRGLAGLARRGLAGLTHRRVSGLTRLEVVLVRQKRGPARQEPGPGPMPGVAAARPPGHLTIAGFALAVAIAAVLVRVRYPLDEWVPLLGFIQTEPARLAQNTAFFVAGVFAYRRGWLARLPRRTGLAWLATGVGLAAVVFLVGADASWFAPGGVSWASVRWTLLETFMAVGLCVGLLTLFRERFAGSNRVSRALAASSYTIYVIHVPIVVTLQFAFVGTGLPVPVTFAAVAVLALLASCAAAQGVRRLPGLRALL